MIHQTIRRTEQFTSFDSPAPWAARNQLRQEKDE